METVRNSDLECLNAWPTGTVGWMEEREAIVTLNALCQRLGYGRIPQLAAGIEDIWRRGDEAVQEHTEDQRARFEALGWAPTRPAGGG